ncbi:hypothetical protein JCGZ_20459 [Jatropha curcas]|uniref:PPM-type phosphatase domain-containing protein n=1 Tax=Jatropha curcas TaxID=180498 RepID=A0A067JR75_JATCU|nr:protein phosphatase 2C 51 [Jatropha curcas]KDP25303.1 hypothetical protein JCGZ_20459 [Jatropha curcas]
MSKSEQVTSRRKTHLKRSNGCRRGEGMKEMKPDFCSAGDFSLDSGGEFPVNKKRGSKELTSCEATEFGGNESKIHDGHSKELISCFDYSSDKEKKVAKPMGTVMAGCDKEERVEGSMSCESHGSISVIGRRRTMEDAVTVAVRIKVGEFDSYDFFAAYDGHGGAKVANACRDRMHQLLAKELEKGKFLGDVKGSGYWKKVMGVCFNKMEDELSGYGEDMEAMDCPEKTMGSTAVVVMVGKEELVVANCGDSRAVLYRGGMAMALSNDHKPDRPDERERVEAAGGRVIDWNGSRILGVLGTSRSIGDLYLKPFVTSEPEVTVTERSISDQFIVIGTDGLWDVVSNEVACEVVKKCFDGHIRNKRFLDEFNGTRAAEAAAILAELAMARGSKDNISVIVVQLESPK